MARGYVLGLRVRNAFIEYRSRCPLWVVKSATLRVTLSRYSSCGRPALPALKTNPFLCVIHLTHAALHVNIGHLNKGSYPLMARPVPPPFHRYLQRLTDEQLREPFTVDQLTPGTAFRFLRIPPCCYASLGVVYVVDGRCRHNISWRRQLPNGALGSGSGDSISILRRFGKFEEVSA